MGKEQQQQQQQQQRRRRRQQPNSTLILRPAKTSLASNLFTEAPALDIDALFSGRGIAA